MQPLKAWSLSLYLCHLLNCTQILGGQISDTHFVEQKLCHVEDYIEKSCFTQMTRASSRLGCFVLCSLDPDCHGVLIFTPEQKCYLRSSICDGQDSCESADTEYRYYGKKIFEITSAPSTEVTTATESPTEVEQSTESTDTIHVPCQNGGIENVVTHECDCTSTGGYVGEKCERAATTCEELHASNYSRGTYSLTIDVFKDASVFYPTTCHLKTWYSDMVAFEIMKSTGSFDTALSYEDYVSGFRLGPDDHWIGLETLHKLTWNGYNDYVRLTVHFNSSTAQGELAISHSGFVVAPASLGYRYALNSAMMRGERLAVEGSTNGFDLNDVLLYQANVPFSTPDKDQDENSVRHCAESAQAGWWFTDCSPSLANPFGRSYQAVPGSATEAHFHLSGLNMDVTSVKEAFKYVYITLEL